MENLLNESKTQQKPGSSLQKSRRYISSSSSALVSTEGREPWTGDPKLPFLPLALKNWVHQVI